MMSLLQPWWRDGWRISLHVGMLFNSCGENLADQLSADDCQTFVATMSVQQFSSNLENPLVWSVGRLSGVQDDDVARISGSLLVV